MSVIAGAARKSQELNVRDESIEVASLPYMGNENIPYPQVSTACGAGG
jgi:uncharacterized protein with ACT and thioredoxin-like domain